MKLWSLPEGRLVDVIASPGGAAQALFSPDGRWLAVSLPRSNTCRLRKVGDWREGALTRGTGLGFSPDGRLLVVDRGTGIVALIEAETGRVVANLEDPNQSWFGGAIFSPDGSHLYLPSDASRTTLDWDLRSVRRQLSAMGLDWDWPPLPESVAPGTAVVPLRIVADLGRHDFSRLPYTQAEIEGLDIALAADPDEWHALLRRAWIFTQCGRDVEAVADLTRALGLRPRDHRALTTRAEALFHQGQYEASFSDSEAALPAAPDQAAAHNNLAWAYVTVPPPARDATKALPHARRGVGNGAEGRRLSQHPRNRPRARLGRHRESVDEPVAQEPASRRRGGWRKQHTTSSSSRSAFTIGCGDPVRARACYDRAVRHEVEGLASSKRRPRNCECSTPRPRPSCRPLFGDGRDDLVSARRPRREQRGPPGSIADPLHLRAPVWSAEGLTLQGGAADSGPEARYATQPCEPLGASPTMYCMVAASDASEGADHGGRGTVGGAAEAAGEDGRREALARPDPGRVPPAPAGSSRPRSTS